MNFLVSGTLNNNCISQNKQLGAITEQNDAQKRQRQRQAVYTLCNALHIFIIIWVFCVWLSAKKP